MSLFNETKTVNCVIQHIKVFHEQAISECVADFGEPCQTCPHIRECDFDWLSVMNPLIQHSAVNFSMVHPGHLNIPDSDDNHHEQDKDTR